MWIDQHLQFDEVVLLRTVCLKRVQVFHSWVLGALVLVTSNCGAGFGGNMGGLDSWTRRALSL